MFGRWLCLCWCVFVDSRQGDSDLTELKSVAAQGSWSALLPDSNITQAGAFLREARVPKVDLCVTLSASLLGWFHVSAVMEPLQVESHDQAKTECSWIRGETEASADATVMTIILLKFSLDLFVNYWKKSYVWKRLPCVNDSTSKCAFLKVCRRYSNIYKC